MGDNSKGLYLAVWRSNLPKIVKAILSGGIKTEIPINKESFTSEGERKSYSFNLEFIDGRLSNNIAGSAVARDLETIISRSEHTKNLLRNSHFKISMNSKFTLTVLRIK